MTTTRAFRLTIDNTSSTLSLTDVFTRQVPAAVYGGLKRSQSTKQASRLQFTITSSAVHGDRDGLARQETGRVQ